MRMKCRITVNKKPWEQIKKRMMNAPVRSVDVGWFTDARYQPDGSRYKTSVPVAWVAMLNEYGHANGGKYSGTRTPPRPIMRVLLKAYAQEGLLGKITFGPLITQVMIGKLSWSKFYKKLGDELVDQIKLIILNKKSPANSPLTVRIKGFNDPLIDSGTMYETVRYRLSKKAAK